LSPPDTGFSVTYTMDKFEPATVPVSVAHVRGDFTIPAATNIDPNPVVAELQPAAPPPRAHRKGVRRKPKTAAAPPPAAGQSAAPAQQ
jgi:hypothetical protein